MAPDPKEYEHLSNKDRMLQGYPYDPFEPSLLEERLKCKRLVREFNASSDEDLPNRTRILKELLSPQSSDKVYIEPNFRCDYGSNITFGDNGYMNFDCCILDVSHVTIGKNFMAAPGVHMYSATHPTDVIERRQYELGLPITIGDDVWIGGMAVICPGVTIGNGVVVGAGSVVTKDVPDYVVVAGNPARIIKHLVKPSDEVLNAPPSLLPSLSQSTNQ